jgi:hypothetical protein
VRTTERAFEVKGINEVEVIVQDHNQADEINKELRPDAI